MLQGTPMLARAPSSRHLLVRATYATLHLGALSDWPTARCKIGVRHIRELEQASTWMLSDVNLHDLDESFWCESFCFSCG